MNGRRQIGWLCVTTIVMLAASIAHADRFEAESPLRQVIDRGARQGVLPVVSLRLDAERTNVLRGREEVILRDFTLAPEQARGRARTVDLDLQRIHVFRPDTLFVDGSAAHPGAPLGAPQPRPDVMIFSGKVLGEDDSLAFLSISPYGTHGYVRIGQRTQVLSSGRFKPDGDNRDVAVFDMAAIPDGAIHWRDFVCQTSSGPIPNPAPIGGNGVAGMGDPPCRRITLAIETDEEYARLFDDPKADPAIPEQAVKAAAYAYVGTLIGASSHVFSTQLNVQFDISFIRLWMEPGSDPWTDWPPAEPGEVAPVVLQLEEFRDEWIDTMGGVPRHLAHFLSGRELGGGAAYGAVFGGLCSPSALGYGVSSGLNGFFPLPLQSNLAQNWDPMVVTHELGHNFSAIHTHEYCGEPLDQCAAEEFFGTCQDEQVCSAGTIMSYCHTCCYPNPDPNPEPGREVLCGTKNIIVEFHEQSVADMLMYLDKVDPVTCPTSCTAADLPDGDFCVPPVAMVCDPFESPNEDWDDWAKLLRNAGSGAQEDEDFDGYGYSVAVSGDLAIVGAPAHDNEELEAFDVGAAYIFRYIEGSATGWVEVAKLMPPDDCVMTNLRFGTSVAIAASEGADIAVVGAPFDHADGQFHAGAVYVFRRVGPTYPEPEVWIPEAVIEEIDDEEKKGGLAGTEDLCDLQPRLTGGAFPDSHANAWFGASVAIMPFRIAPDECAGGDVIVVGAPQQWPIIECEDDGFPIFSGAAFVFRYDEVEGKWRRERKLVPTCSFLSQFGISVTAGYSHVLNHEVVGGGAWLHSYVFFPPPPEDKKERPDPPIGGDFAGAAFTWSSFNFTDGDGEQQTSWLLDGVVIPDGPVSGDTFGQALDFDATFGGDVLIVGAPRRRYTEVKEGPTPMSGSAFFFRRSGFGSWNQEDEVFWFDPDTDLPTHNAAFGSAVSISGDTAVVGAFGQPGPDLSDDAEPGDMVPNVGAAYVFRSGQIEVEGEMVPDWFPVEELKPHTGDPHLGMEFGVSVAISGQTIAVGSWRQHENMIEKVGPFNAGSAYLYGNCPSTCGPEAGSCYLTHATPGCYLEELPSCCSVVCAEMPFCCQGFWSNTCRNRAFQLCGNCGMAFAGLCDDDATGERGCSNWSCCTSVCAIESRCCTVEWDSDCVAIANGLPECDPGLCPASVEGCDTAHGTPGCDDEPCCEAVCSVLPDCCDVGWDQDCVDFEEIVCAPAGSPVPISCPPDIDGNGVVNGFDLVELLSCWGPTFPACEDADIDGNGTVNGFDLVELLSQWGPCQ